MSNKKTPADINNELISGDEPNFHPADDSIGEDLPLFEHPESTSTHKKRAYLKEIISSLEDSQDTEKKEFASEGQGLNETKPFPPKKPKEAKYPKEFAVGLGDSWDSEKSKRPKKGQTDQENEADLVFDTSVDEHKSNDNVRSNISCPHCGKPLGANFKYVAQSKGHDDAPRDYPRREGRSDFRRDFSPSHGGGQRRPYGERRPYYGREGEGQGFQSNNSFRSNDFGGEQRREYAPRPGGFRGPRNEGGNQQGFRGDSRFSQYPRSENRGDFRPPRYNSEGQSQSNFENQGERPSRPAWSNNAPRFGGNQGFSGRDNRPDRPRSNGDSFRPRNGGNSGGGFSRPGRPKSHS